jgi:hypothetical protein
MKINKPTLQLRKKVNRIRALQLMERVDTWRSHIDFAVEMLEHTTGLQGEALARYCQSQGYSLILHLIFDPQTGAFCKGGDL